MTKKIFLLLAFTFISLKIFSQELNCMIDINSQQISGDKRVFDAMHKSIYEFLNYHNWTNEKYQPSERIECHLTIIVNKRPSSDRFECKMQFLVSRPAYNSSYKSSLILYADDAFNFNYVESQNMEFNENSYTSNLISLLGFYAYIAIGLDKDSFSNLGGTPYFEKAQNILNLAQTGGEGGWKGFGETQSRYWLLENLTNDSYKAVREASYLYHLQGLDKMPDDAYSGRAKIIESIQKIYKVWDEYPTLYILKIFFDAKGDEIINIMKKAEATEKKNIVQMLSEMDPSKSSNYNTILTGK